MPQTGVGLTAYKTTEEKAEAAAIFAHWLTESQRNLEFVADTGYMPVTDDAFEAIDDYEFQSESYHNLYASMKVMSEQYTAVVRPVYDAFYNRIDILYEGLRQMQDELSARAENGEDIDVLAEETWAFFSSIQ